MYIDIYIDMYMSKTKQTNVRQHIIKTDLIHKDSDMDPSSGENKLVSGHANNYIYMYMQGVQKMYARLTDDNSIVLFFFAD